MKRVPEKHFKSNCGWSILSLSNLELGIIKLIFYLYHACTHRKALRKPQEIAFWGIKITNEVQDFWLSQDEFFTLPAF